MDERSVVVTALHGRARQESLRLEQWNNVGVIAEMIVRMVESQLCGAVALLCQTASASAECLRYVPWYATVRELACRHRTHGHRHDKDAPV